MNSIFILSGFALLLTSPFAHASGNCESHIVCGNATASCTSLEFSTVPTSLSVVSCQTAPSMQSGTCSSKEISTTTGETLRVWTSKICCGPNGQAVEFPIPPSTNLSGLQDLSAQLCR